MKLDLAKRARLLARVRLLAAGLTVFGSFGLRGAVAQEIPLTPVATGFNNPIGIDHHSPSGKLVLSVNFPTGLPHNFELVGPDGSRTQFSDIQGLTDEVKIATVRGGPCQGGFAVGELFTGTGVPGVIARIAPDGSAVQNPWVTLPDEPGLLRGSLFQDRYCAFGGDLLVVTTAGNVWQVSSAGTATLLASVGTHLEGLTTVPNDPARYGPWAGRALAGAEEQGRVYAIGRDGSVAFYELGINPEDIDIIPANENFFGVDFAGRTIWGASSQVFADKVGDFLMSQEFPGILWHVRWNGSSFQVVEVARVGQWEHITFSPAGVPPIPPATPCGKPTVTESDLPFAFTLVGNEWSAGVSISAADGLVVNNVTLGPRYMANQISVPYFMIATSALSPTRGELKPAGDDPVARSRLVGYRTAPGNPTFVEATYAIDRIPAGSTSCLVVTQRYELWDEQPHGGCEPTAALAPFPPHAAPLPCSRWKPLITYEFTGANGETLASFGAPQRLYLRDEDKHPNLAATFQDEDIPVPNFRGPHGVLELIAKRHDFDVEQPPLTAIAGGQKGDWDNYHQSFKTITGPQSIQFPFTFGAPGCPECVHIHWRWGLVVPEGFPDRHDGTPIIPGGSTQDVEFTVVAHRDGEEHPNDFHDLINGESLREQDLVLWYSATGNQPSDTFFFHGGFFQPADEADLGVTMTGPPIAHQNESVTYELAVTNNGPSFATDVELRDFWDLIETQFVAADSSAQCSLATLRLVLCDLGDIRPGTTVPLRLTFKAASMAGEPLVNHAVLRQSRKDPNGTNDHAKVKTEFVP
jgi:uncharacterized repeat protein (TIGR01451 family)